MTPLKLLAALLALSLAVAPELCRGRADEPAKAAGPGTLVIVDAAGKEQKLKAWKFTAGTRTLSWLAPANPDREADPKARAPSGPEALEFREDNSTLFVDGILTLVPLDRVRSLDYDAEKETVTARVATGAKADADVELTGPIKYPKINKLTIEAEVDKGDLGIAEVKFLGGTARGIRGIRFAAPKVEAPVPAGRPALVITADRDKKTTHKVADLQALYRLPAGPEQVLPTLMFKKTLKLDVAKIQKIVSASGESDDTSWQVVLKDGNDSTLTLLRTIPLDGKQAHLEGLLGRIPAGYKLFPTHTVAEILFDATEEPEK